MATMVTPLPPVTTVKTLLATMHTMASPPGSHPSSAEEARTMRSGAFDSAIM